jgi:hypothetical protein
MSSSSKNDPRGQNECRRLPTDLASERERHPAPREGTPAQQPSFRARLGEAPVGRCEGVVRERLGKAGGYRYKQSVRSRISGVICVVGGTVPTAWNWKSGSLQAKHSLAC